MATENPETKGKQGKSRQRQDKQNNTTDKEHEKHWGIYTQDNKGLTKDRCWWFVAMVTNEDSYGNKQV